MFTYITIYHVLFIYIHFKDRALPFDNYFDKSVGIQIKCNDYSKYQKQEVNNKVL